MTIIDLQECDSLLRKFYYISNIESLYIIKFDIVKDRINTLKVEYNAYIKLLGENLTKLNLTAYKTKHQY